MLLILLLILFLAFTILIIMAFTCKDPKKANKLILYSLILLLISFLPSTINHCINTFVEKIVSNEVKETYLLSKQTFKSYTGEDLLQYSVTESENGNFNFKYIKEEEEIELELSKDDIIIHLDNNVEAPFLVIYKETQVPKSNVFRFLTWPSATSETTYEIYISANEIINFKQEN